MCATFIAFLDSLEEPAAESDWLEIPVHLFEILPLEDPAHTASMALIQVYVLPICFRCVSSWQNLKNIC